jgi:hypothetical protein
LIKSADARIKVQNEKTLEVMRKKWKQSKKISKMFNERNEIEDREEMPTGKKKLKYIKGHYRKIGNKKVYVKPHYRHKLYNSVQDTLNFI